jgi:hypothetical protein
MLRFGKLGWMMACVAGTMALGLPASAMAHTGEFEKFNDCPSTTEGVAKCLVSVTNKGTIVLGNKTTPIVNPVTLQGGISEEDSEGFSNFYGAINGGETLSKTPQPVPGGLAGIVPPESAPLLVKLALAFFFENELTGVNATLELAQPASEIKVSDYNLLAEEGIALKLPVRVHLENPFLGSSCYVGSSSAPVIWWNLTTGTTSPPAPNTPISGKSGYIELKEKFSIVQITENTLVDNAWAAPKATGCGGALSLLVDPVIDLAVGLPAEAGKNSATLENTITVAAAGAVNKH